MTQPSIIETPVAAGLKRQAAKTGHRVPGYKHPSIDAETPAISIAPTLPSPPPEPHAVGSATNDSVADTVVSVAAASVSVRHSVLNLHQAAGGLGDAAADHQSAPPISGIVHQAKAGPILRGNEALPEVPQSTFKGTNSGADSKGLSYPPKTKPQVLMTAGQLPTAVKPTRPPSAPVLRTKVLNGPKYPWLRGAYYSHTVFFPLDIKTDIETWRWKLAKEDSLVDLLRYNPRRRGNSEDRPRVWNPLMFGPAANSPRYTTIEMTLRGITKQYIGLKYPQSAPIPSWAIAVREDEIGLMNKTFPSTGGVFPYERMVAAIQDYFRGCRKAEIEVEKIKDKDHPAYDGGRGYRVCVKKAIPKGTIIGCYSGIIERDVDLHRLAIQELTAPELEKERCRWAYSYDSPVAHAKEIRWAWARAREHRGHHESRPYLDEDENEDESDGDFKEDDNSGRRTNRSVKESRLRGVYTALEKMPSWEKGENREYGMEFPIDSMEVRNETSIINDRRNFEVVLGYPSGFKHAANVRAVGIHVFGIPHEFIISMRKLHPGEELLLDYGAAYWNQMDKCALYWQEINTAKCHENECRTRMEKALKRQRELLAQQEDYRTVIEKMRQEAGSRDAAMALDREEANERYQALLQELGEADESVLELEKRLKGAEESVRLRMEAVEHKQRLQRIEQTLGCTVDVRHDAYCIYSIAAELEGLGARHIVGNSPDGHYRPGRCKFVEPFGDAVLRCKDCGVRYMAGTTAAAAHAKVCLHYRAARLERLKLIEAQVRIDELEDGEAAMGNKEARISRWCSGPHGFQTMLLRLLKDLVLDGTVLPSLMAGFIQSVLKAAGPRNFGDCAWKRHVAITLGLQPTEEKDVDLALLDLTNCCKVMTDLTLRPNILENNCPRGENLGEASLAWLFDFAEEFLALRSTTEELLVGQSNADPREVVEDLATLLLEGRARARHYVMSDRLKKELQPNQNLDPAAFELLIPRYRLWRLADFIQNLTDTAIRGRRDPDWQPQLRIWPSAYKRKRERESDWAILQQAKRQKRDTTQDSSKQDSWVCPSTSEGITQVKEEDHTEKEDENLTEKEDENHTEKEDDDRTEKEDEENSDGQVSEQNVCEGVTQVKEDDDHPESQAPEHTDHAGLPISQAVGSSVASPSTKATSSTLTDPTTTSVYATGLVLPSNGTETGPAAISGERPKQSSATHTAYEKVRELIAEISKKVQMAPDISIISAPTNSQVPDIIRQSGAIVLHSCTDPEVSEWCIRCIRRDGVIGQLLRQREEFQSFPFGLRWAKKQECKEVEDRKPESSTEADSTIDPDIRAFSVCSPSSVIRFAPGFGWTRVRQWMVEVDCVITRPLEAIARSKRPALDFKKLRIEGWNLRRGRGIMTVLEEPLLLDSGSAPLLSIGFEYGDSSELPFRRAFILVNVVSQGLGQLTAANVELSPPIALLPGGATHLRLAVRHTGGGQLRIADLVTGTEFASRQKTLLLQGNRTIEMIGSRTQPSIEAMKSSNHRLPWNLFPYCTRQILFRAVHFFTC